MNARHFLLGIATGLSAGYAAARAVEAARILLHGQQPNRRDAAEYGALRRSFAVSGIVRSLSASAALAYGPLGAQLERRVSRLPRWARSAAYVAQLSLLQTLLELPVDFVEGHATEHRYGLSEQPARSWLADHAKQSAIGAAVATLLSAAFAAVLRRFPRTWPYLASVGVFPLLLAANVVVPLYVLPLFNTYEPLTGPLEERLRKLAARYGVGDAEILRMNMSKQTKKANAFVIGIGNTHRIVIGDTLIAHFPDEEIEFVVAHELGHYVLKDTWRMIAVSQVAAMVTLFGAFALNGTRTTQNDTRQLARIQLWSTVLSQALRPALSAFARSREWAADHFAVRATQAPRIGASAFRRLRDQNLAEDEQPAWFEFIFSTHPSLKARITSLEGA